MLPEPDAVHVPPPAPTQVQVQASTAGKVSATVAPVAGIAVAFEAVIVYTTDPPGTAVATPSVLVMPRSATAAAWTLMHPLAVTLCPSGLVMVTFCSPVASAVMFSVTWVGVLNVTLLTMALVTVAAMWVNGSAGGARLAPGS